MNPQQEPHDNVEPRTARPGKAHPVANTEYENSSRQTSPIATLGFVSRPAGSDVDGGPVGSGTLRKPQVDEEYVMEEFERHTDHCIKCSPTPDKLCSKGYGDGLNCQGYAFDVIEYLCCINDQVYSLVDRSQVRVCKSPVVVWSLLRTMQNGLRFDGIAKGKLDKVERHIREVKNGLQGRGWWEERKMVPPLSTGIVGTWEILGAACMVPLLLCLCRANR